MNENPKKKDHRAAVGPAHNFDVIGALQFSLLIALGLRERHSLLDVGCGSLRGGRFFIVYLNRGNYFGIEPAEWLVVSGITQELGMSVSELKAPRFHTSDRFDFDYWDTKFDYILAQSILTHTSPMLMKKCLLTAHEVMHSKSVFAFTVMHGDNYKGAEGWVAGGRVASYNHAFIIRTLVDCGFKHVMMPRWPHPSGQVWYVVSKDKLLLDRLHFHLPVWKEGMYGVA